MKRIIALCFRCYQNYIAAGKKLKRTNNNIKSSCEYCCIRQGLDYLMDEAEIKGQPFKTAHAFLLLHGAALSLLR